jgi:type III restriction enzyme
MKGAVVDNQGRPTIKSPGDLTTLDLNPYRQSKRQQQLIFELAKSLTCSYCSPENLSCEAPAQILFPQLYKICDQYFREKVTAIAPAAKIDVYLAPYFGWVIENLSASIYPDTNQGENPELPRLERHRADGSTDDVNFWTSKRIYQVEKSHVNCVVADTYQWEQATAYAIDTHPITAAFVKNDHLGLSIPYFYNSSDRDYYPDFIIRLNQPKLQYLILETKGYIYEGTKEKAAAAQRWVKAVNANRSFGQWRYQMCALSEVRKTLDQLQVEFGLV